MIHYARINKTQQKELDRYIVALGIKTDGEKFVLEHILKRDWGRDILLVSIEMTKYNASGCQGLVCVKCTTRNGAYYFSVSHLGGNSWTTHDVDEQKNYISRNLYNKMD